MLKRTLVLLICLILLSACGIKEYTFQVKDEIIVFQQSDEKFDISMLEDYVALYYGESEESLVENAQIEGDVNLKQVGTYPISLYAAYKSRVSEVELNVLVVDIQKPTFHIFENELLVYIDEQLAIDSHNFFINLVDGINGQINNRISVEGDYTLDSIKTYPIKLVGTDESGNQTTADIKLRVTDIIDEKALYLYKKANLAAHGENFVFEDNNPNNKILNFQDALAVFTPNYREHFYWLSGITGTYNNEQSGVKLSFVDKDAYADFSEAKKINGYKQTKLTLQYETDNYRHYIARSYYAENDDEIVKLAKFVIRQIEGVWYVDEFYMPN